MKTIEIVIVDDHELVRQGLSTMLKACKGIEVVGSFASGLELIDHEFSKAPDVYVMDIKMPEMNGFEVAAVLKDRNENSRIILLSMEVNHSYIKRAIHGGIDGYIPKNSSIDILLDAIHKVESGDKYFDNHIKDYMFQLMINDSSLKTTSPEISRLTEREQHVLRMIVDGKQNREIAELLFISTKTVETHRNNILKKLDIDSTANLVKFAIANGLTSNPYQD